MKSPLLKQDKNWTELTPAKTHGTGMSPVMIPETIAGCILAPVPFSFVERRIKEERASVTPGVQQKRIHRYSPEG